MRGGDERSGSLFSYVDLEARVGKDHPLRTIRAIVNEALSALAGEFSALYSPIGRPSIPPEKLLRAMLLASVLFDPLGAAIDGAAGVRSAVPLVRRHRHRRRGVGSFGFFQEPRALVGRRHRSQAVERSSCAAASEAAFEHATISRSTAR